MTSQRLHKTAGRSTIGSGARTGRRFHAEVRCWEKAHAAAQRAANAEALAAIADRGIAAALEYAEVVQSPATRGAVLVSIWFDPAEEGNLRRRVSYERALE